MEEIVAVPPILFPSIDFYIGISHFRGCAVDWNARFDKRYKSAHRYLIADVNGPLSLTVPIRKPDSLTAARWSDIIISPHGNWQSVHLTALESAYRRTPFFEFYVDSFRPLYSSEWNDRPLREYVEASHRLLSILLPLPPFTTYETGTPIYSAPSVEISPYWQPRADKLGFVPGLSILDTLFCLGPETALLLKH